MPEASPTEQMDKDRPVGPDPFLTVVLVAQVVASLAMTGLIWTIQLVHYPLLAEVPAEAFVAHEAEHTRRITWIVGPLMAVEGVCVLVLLALRPDAMSWWLPWAGAFAEAVAIGVTAFVSAPTHGRLQAGHDRALLDHLIATNWFRTVAWTARGVLSVVMLLQVR